MEHTYKGITVEGWPGFPDKESWLSYFESHYLPEVDYEEPISNWVEERYGVINMFPPQVYFISPCLFDENDDKYKFLDTLPKLLLNSKKIGSHKFHGVLFIGGAFSWVDYYAEIEFETVNDVLVEIKKAIFKMYANKEIYKPYCQIEFLRLERLGYNPKNGFLGIFITN